jgi:hypothetical protein
LRKIKILGEEQFTAWFAPFASLFSVSNVDEQ